MTGPRWNEGGLRRARMAGGAYLSMTHLVALDDRRSRAGRAGRWSSRTARRIVTPAKKYQARRQPVGRRRRAMMGGTARPDHDERERRARRDDGGGQAQPADLEPGGHQADGGDQHQPVAHAGEQAGGRGARPACATKPVASMPAAVTTMPMAMTLRGPHRCDSTPPTADMTV